MNRRQDGDSTPLQRLHLPLWQLALPNPRASGFAGSAQVLATELDVARRRIGQLNELIAVLDGIQGLLASSRD